MFDFVAQSIQRLILHLAVIGALAAAFPGAAESADSPLGFELRVHENRIDGCTDCGCRLKGSVGTDEPQSLWVSFGLVKPGDDDAWRVVDSASRCGLGAFEEAASTFYQTIGMPFMVVQITTRIESGRSDELRLSTELNYSRFQAFDDDGPPIRSERSATRAIRIKPGEGVVIPVYLPEAAHSDWFEVHDVTMGLSIHVPEQERTAQFGLLEVTADVPGAAVLLDGGLVGRTVHGEPLVLSNIASGKHEITIVDHSGRGRTESIRVRKGKTARLHVEVLDLADADLATILLPIGENPQGYPEFWRPQDSAMVVNIPGGSFKMGSPEGQGEPDERPQHEVTVDSFLMDKTEVTWRQYRQFAKATGERWPTEPVWGFRDNYPVSFILPREAANYCQWVSGRLPTEPEWEFAARGTDGRVYPWGDKWDPTRCNSIAGGMHQPEPAGFSPSCVSPFGVLDMSGNVWEWTLNAYTPYPLEISDDLLKLDESGRPTRRAMRGGAWMSHPSWVRTAYRHARSLNSRLMDHGFRCVMDPAEDGS